MRVKKHSDNGRVKQIRMRGGRCICKCEGSGAEGATVATWCHKGERRARHHESGRDGSVVAHAWGRCLRRRAACRRAERSSQDTTTSVWFALVVLTDTRFSLIFVFNIRHCHSFSSGSVGNNPPSFFRVSRNFNQKPAPPVPLNNSHSFVAQWIHTDVTARMASDPAFRSHVMDLPAIKGAGWQWTPSAT